MLSRRTRNVFVSCLCLATTVAMTSAGAHGGREVKQESEPTSTLAQPSLQIVGVAVTGPRVLVGEGRAKQLLLSPTWHEKSVASFEDGVFALVAITPQSSARSIDLLASVRLLL
jgi:hypothetical protein